MTGKFIDMFAGMGTVRIGFEKAGWMCVSAIEFDPHKREIYEVIFGHEPEFGDITAVRGADLPSADCWCFGAPCQDFSVAGLRAGLDGERSGLVREVFRLVREKAPADRPEWLLYENVKGMLSSNSGWDFAAIQAEMGQCGYDVQWQLLNSKYFGVPQNRDRVYTLGRLRARGARKVFPLAESDGVSAESRTGAREENQCAAAVTKDYAKAPNARGENYVRQVGNVMPTATRDNPNASGIYTNVSPEYYRGPLKGLSRTVKADGGHPVGVMMDDCIRKLTPRECMRLQGVPDSITDKLIAAGISDTQLYRAAGDACTVNVIYEIARRM